VGRLPLEMPHYPATYGLVDPTVAGGGGVEHHGADWRPVPRHGVGAEAVAGLPLYALLSQALLAFALDYESDDHGPFPGHGPFATAAFLRHVPDDGTPLAETPFRAPLSQTTRYTLVRWALGGIEKDPATEAPVIRLAARGRAWRDAYGPMVEAVTAAWRESYGPITVSELAAAAEALAPDLPPGIADHPLDA
jgi:hypothetical protein